MVKSRLIVVLGMHRSGTSAVTRALQVMNVNLGDRLMPAAEDNSSKGFFEDIDICALNVKILKALEIEWFSLASVEAHDLETLRKKGYFLLAVELLKSKRARFPIFAFKDPRVAKLLPFWHAVFQHCGFDVSYVVTVRHPRSVAKSLAKRDGFDLDQGYLLWLDHMIKIISFSQESPCVYVDYDRLIQTPDTQLKRMSTALRLKLDAVEVKSFKTEFLDPSLRHTVFTRDDLDIDASCLPLVREIYSALVGLTSITVTKRGRPAESQILKWTAEFLRLKPTLLYVDKLAEERSANALKLVVPSKFFQVFFDQGEGFSESDSVRIDTLAATVATEFVVDLPGGGSLAGLRVDPLNDFVAVRISEILLVQDNDVFIDLLPLSRPEAVVSPERVHYFQTQDPAIHFDLSAEALLAARRIRITLTYVATGSDAQRKYGDQVHAMRELELQELLRASHGQLQQLERGLSEKAGSIERQLANEKALLVAQHATREQELLERVRTSQDEMQHFERSLIEKAGSVERQLDLAKSLLVTQHAQAERELRQAHASRERELLEQTLALQNQAQLVTQHAQADKEMREAHAARELELHERLRAVQGEMRQLERVWSNKALMQEQHTAQQKALLDKDFQALREQLRAAEREKALIAIQQVRLDSTLNQAHFASESELRERLISVQEHMRKLEREQIEKTIEKERLQAQQVQLDRSLNEAHASREYALHERLLASQDEIQKLHQQSAEKTEELQRLQAHETTQLNSQLHALQMELKVSELEQQRVLAQYDKSASDLTVLKVAQVQAITALQQLTREYSQTLHETSRELAAIKTAWFWRPLSPLSAATRIFRGTSLATSEAPAHTAHDFSNNSANYAPSRPSVEFDLDAIVALDGAEFIKCVYQAVLGRNPDQEGFQYYSRRLEKTADKRALIYQIYSSPEARKLGRRIFGIEKAMRREKIKRILKIQRPIQSVARLFGINRFNSAPSKTGGRLFTPDIEAVSFKIEREAKKLALIPNAGATVNQEMSIQGSPSERKPYTLRDTSGNITAEVGYSHSAEADRQQIAAMPLHGLPREDGPPAAIALESKITTSKVTLRNISSYFMEAVENEVLQSDGYSFTRLMMYVWNSRLDLQRAFDIYQSQGRVDYAIWFLCTASDEYGLTANVYPSNLLEKLASVSGVVGEKALSVIKLQDAANSKKLNGVDVIPAQSNNPGANLIGYAFGEFGMGEHVRMVARALSKTDMAFCVLDQGVGVHGAGDMTVSEWVVDVPKFEINVFHVSADVYPPLYFKFGESMFAERYNIGYWAWELSKCPPEFDVALSMVDEVWVISDFVADSFKTRSVTPVLTMPLAVTVPKLDSKYTKNYYSLPEDSFIFLYTFDAASYLERKNPVATVRAFKSAFPVGGHRVHLVLKTMNIEVAGSMWGELAAEAKLDPRIIIFTHRMSRNDVLGLNLACDAFVSLHRSEGFGRCVAEAMAYGKPVIVTNYSGTRDFANERTACLVNYRLVPVPSGMYPFGEGQVWAEPDVKHAAQLMTVLVENETYRNKIAHAGQQYILDNFNEIVVGARYARRLQEIISLRRQARSDQPKTDLQVSANNLEGCLDLPADDAVCEVTDSVSVEGWAISQAGIASVHIFINSRLVGQAHYGVLRNDVYKAYFKIPNSARSGFCFLVETSSLAQGSHELKVMVTDRSGSIKTWVRQLSLLPSFRYAKWLANTENSHERKIQYAPSKPASFFSIILRTGLALDEKKLNQTLRSLKVQRSAHFEVLLVSPAIERDKVIQVFKRSGLRCKVMVVDGSEMNWNALLAKCHGSAFAVLDAGNVIRSDALKVVDGIFINNRQADLIYGDEDHILHGVRTCPLFKPSWSPVLLENYNYIGNAWFARTELAERAMTKAPDFAAVHDAHYLLKQIGQVASHVVHLPVILLSRMEQHEVVSVVSSNKSELNQNHVDAALPKVSIIIPTCLNDIALVERCFTSLTHLTAYPDVEVIVIFNNVRDGASADSWAKKWPFTFLYWNGTFNWSAINNFGASKASGDCLLFMNDDVESIEEDWLQILVRTLLKTGAGAVGPLLCYPNGTVQHAGIYVGTASGGMRHFFRFATTEQKDRGWLMKYPREVSAVTGACLLTTRACFNAADQFDENLPLVCNDTDYCFRIAEKEYWVVMEPQVKLIHHEGVSRAGISEDEDVAKFRIRWSSLLKRCDMFSNPNLDTSRDDWIVDPDSKQHVELRISKSRPKSVLK